MASTLLQSEPQYSQSSQSSYLPVDVTSDVTGVLSKGNNKVKYIVSYFHNNSSLVIMCYYCSNCVHMACLLRQFKETKVSKVGVEWISEFISISHIKYVCLACHEMHKNSTLVSLLNGTSAFTQNEYALTAPFKCNIDLNFWDLHLPCHSRAISILILNTIRSMTYRAKLLT